jgi:hypothetical protein
MRKTKHVAYTENVTNAYKSLVEKLKEKRPFERPRRRREDTMERILEKCSGKVWTGFIWLKIRFL